LACFGELRRAHSISQQLLQLIAGVPFTFILSFPFPFPANEIEVLAEIGGVLVAYGLGPAIAALVSCADIVAYAVEADFEIGAALVTTLGPAWQAVDRVLPPATMTMTSQHDSKKINQQLATDL
jgi:hypothetical protein